MSVEFGDRVAPLLILAAFDGLGEKARQPVVLEDLAVRRDVALIDAVTVLHPNLERVALQVRGDLLDDVLDSGNTLRPSEPSECRVRR